MKEHQIKFLNMAIEVNALMFGDFTLKSGRKSPYFFNIASFIQSGHLSDLADLYVREIINNQINYDVIFGPAYKGIPLASAVSVALSREQSRPIPVCFDRKEEKVHGEGGKLVGSVENKNVLIIDDVLTAGTALNNSIRLIQEAKGSVSAAIVALDRQELEDNKRISGSLREELNIPIYSISDLDNLIDFLERSEGKKKIATKLKSLLIN